eukprot:6180531-Pleurochrysis_carterae.AAC.1
MQSSYDDVEAEVKIIQENSLHSCSSVLFIGCDEARFSRTIHRLSHNPQKYLMTEPVVTPQLGEHLHGSFHVLQDGWRQWSPLIKRSTTLLNRTQVCADPIVSLFNEHEHFLRVLTEGFSKWPAFISYTGIHYHAA